MKTKKQYETLWNHKEYAKVINLYHNGELVSTHNFSSWEDAESFEEELIQKGYTWGFTREHAELAHVWAEYGIKNNVSNKKLKWCPNCGEEKRFDIRDWGIGEHLFYIRCDCCDFEIGPITGSKERAIMAWNSLESDV